MAIHELKTYTTHFKEVWAGNKVAEIRQRDHDFAVGDKVILVEITSEYYTGRAIKATITHILDHFFGIANGFCMLSLKFIWNESLYGKKRLINPRPKTSTVKSTDHVKVEVDLTSTCSTSKTLRDAAEYAERFEWSNAPAHSLFTIVMSKVTGIPMNSSLLRTHHAWQYLEQFDFTGEMFVGYTGTRLGIVRHKIIALHMAATIAEDEGL